MKTFVGISLALSVFLGANSFGATLFSDTFSDPNGALLGQNPQVGGTWTITGTSTVNPIAVNNGSVTLTNTGQDAYSAFNSAVNTADGGSLFIGLDLDVTAAQTAGDYFLHVTTTTGGTSGFYDKLEARSSGSGYELGLEEAGSDAVEWGTTVLSLGTTYRIVTEEDFVSGALNDTFELYVNPTDLSVAGNNASYLNFAWNGTTAEATTYAEVNLRQGTAANAPTETIDNLIVGTAFSDVSSVPEPATLALAALGGAAGLLAFRRRKA